jgi:hypothetical protein
MGIELPTKKIAPEHLNPRKLFIYSPPKMGKTSLLAELDNCLIIDLENGSSFVDALKLEANNLDELKSVIVAIIEAKKGDNPLEYDYIAIDTLTKLEELVVPYAKTLYRATPMGKSFDYDSAGNDLNTQSVLSLPNGAGYGYLREALEKVRKALEGLPKKGIIYTGHLKEKFIEKQGKEVNAKDIDLTGKIKNIVCADMDAIAYLYREGNKTFFSFKASDEVLCGSRCKHLKGKDVLMSELDGESGKFTTYWDSIFLPEKTNKVNNKTTK